ncbi:solute carrier family 52, riboflavin transporter, member 3-A [Neodiprion pinetum]|uniref:Riboflavin transporter n=1 Tax=Neodiprion lecontei TaxID=441921 RepID=A0A6J0C011_NEOLC|nr:solute carrier family 52, riboflavin transporter, member 3-A [Neodiprion lecontei]XP_046464993.1 solute carrier family 52, riboflavin transporter, member 3-A-like [Neodiprion pinetum]XP_046602835.1 solute carrier family 52, riboflavin transporter, member 3-A-like [Neodiprion virginianus]
MTLAQRFSNRRLLVDALALTFGIGAWIGVNGIFVQLPLLVENAPEEWHLPVYMTLVVQLANIGPILYSFYIKYMSRAHDHLLIYILLGGGTIGMICLIFVHENTSHIFGKESSTALLSLMFVAALVGCTSSVLFMPYMRNYREIYLVSYLVGEGLSGFLPSIIALIQGVGGNAQCVETANSTADNPSYTEYVPDPRFSTSVFFTLLSVILFLSFSAFIALNTLPISRGERVKPPGSTEALPTDPDAAPTFKINSGWKMPRRTYIYLLAMMAVICALGNAVLSGVQPYACLPYGNVAYHLAVTLGAIASPLAMCIGFVVKNPRVDVLSLLTAGILALAGFVSYLAVKSPAPPMQHMWIGEFVVVVAWIIVSGLIGFVKLAITTLFRPDPGRGLFYTGVATQIGSLSGAVLMYCLVKFADIFVKYNPCDDFAGVPSS